LSAQRDGLVALRYDIVFWYVLVAIAAKNPLGSVAVFAWGNCVAPLGIIPGAFIGRSINQLLLSDVALLTLANAVMLLVFIGYVFIALKRFSFVETITGLEPDVAPAQAELTQPLEVLVAELSHRYGLTPRETEVFAMLAKGRNGSFIKDALVVSYNTVKAHVKHIYVKLGVHNHQELIDLLEAGQ